MTDLFGNEIDDRASLRPIAQPVALNLFDAAAERAALESSRPVSQERTELFHPYQSLNRTINAVIQPDSRVKP